MTPATTVVLDASAVVQAFVQPPGDAAEWLAAVDSGRLRAFVPDLIFAETASALTTYVRAGDLSAARSAAILREVTTLPLHVASLRGVVPAAHRLALDRGLSVYDACYLAVALSADATLVTADPRLAEAAEDSALVPGARPSR